MFNEEFNAAANAAAAKSRLLKNNPAGYFVMSVIAGMFIGFGVLLVFTLGGALAGSPFTKLVMGSCFAVALSLVVMAGAELFTGNNLAMAAGLICGMGYFLYAAVFTLVICLALIILKLTGFGEARDEKELHITIPEDLDYEGMFDEIFEKYALERKLISVKTTDMGSLFRLKYHVTLRNGASEKEFIDKLRIRNGNLPITICISQPADSPAQL